MKLCAAIPLVDIGGEPQAVREFAEAAEACGYDGLALADHVLGVNTANRPGWGGRATSATLYHDPFLLFSFLAPISKGICTRSGAIGTPSRICRSGRQCTEAGARNRLTGLGFLPLPRWLMPSTVCFESGDGDRFVFDIDVKFPLIGQLIHYRGWLLPQS